MLHASRIGSIARAVAFGAALSAGATGVRAHDESMYPDWSGQWHRPPGVGVQWDQTKPPGRGQRAPLTPEYQALFEANLVEQAMGGQGEDARLTCLPNGMPRMMTVVMPAEFVILPKITYINFEYQMPRRVYTDGRAFPKTEEPSFAGYSIGKWIDADGDRRYDTLAVETRDPKGPRTFEASGLPLHRDNQTVVKERIALDRRNKNILLNEITTIDNALTRAWTVTKRYHRERKGIWLESNCTENNQHIVVGKENYFLSADGYLMPTRKNQAPPDLRYFTQSKP